MALFFMAHLRKLPTYFVKGDERRAAYYTIQARELKAAGFVEEGATPNKPIEAHKPAERQPEIVVEAGADAFDSTDSLTEPMADEDALEEMTKAELLDWAMDHGHDLKNALPKAEIFKLCKEIKESL
jgi:hypothetical protein